LNVFFNSKFQKNKKYFGIGKNLKDNCFMNSNMLICRDCY
jgi:hypothetical protein